MDRLREMEIFVQVVDSGSLSAAARGLGLSVAVVSKEIARLEQRLGARLLTRNSRHLALTTEGALFHTHSQRLIADVAEAEAVVSEHSAQMSGPMRITAPVAFGRQFVAPLLADFAERFPRLSLHLHLSDSLVNLAEDNMDLAIRMGGVSESGLIVRTLAANVRILCAAPAYLARAGIPETPEDLSHHAMLIIGSDAARTYRLNGPHGEERQVRFSARLSSSNGEVIHDWALQGLGLEIKAWLDVANDIQTGRIIRVLPGWTLANSALHAVFPARRHIPQRIRLFVDELQKSLPKFQA